MISLNRVIVIHGILIDKFGGSTGIRDMQVLQSAIHRPFQTFDKKDLYPTILEKAAALFESLIINHPFIDGNKRIAYVTMRIFLIENKLDIICSEQEKYSFVIKASEGILRYNDIHQWLVKNAFSVV